MMNTKDTENKAIQVDNDNLRKELESKIKEASNSLDGKIQDDKSYTHGLITILVTIFVAVMGGLFAYVIYSNARVVDEVKELREKVLRVEVKLDERLPKK